MILMLMTMTHLKQPKIPGMGCLNSYRYNDKQQEYENVKTRGKKTLFVGAL